MTNIHGLLLGSLIIIIILSLFCGAFGIGTFSEDLDPSHTEEPEAYNVVTFIGGGFLSLLTFQLEGAPIVLSLIFWFLIMCASWSIVCLVRGIS